MGDVAEESRESEGASRTRRRRRGRSSTRRVNVRVGEEKKNERKFGNDKNHFQSKPIFQKDDLLFHEPKSTTGQVISNIKSNEKRN